MMKMAPTELLTKNKLNDVLAYLNYQGPLYLRRIEELPQTSVKSSPLLSLG
jgi:hypothetical protein